MARRFLGITVLSDYILSEGVDAVLDNIVSRAGATAVACNPIVTEPAPEGAGSFQPPTDAGSSPRLFDRPLFGKRALWVRSGPSYEPREAFYRDSPYPPRQPNELTRRHGPEIARFISAARERGLEVYFQTGAAQPPGLRPEDVPRLPGGGIPENRMAQTASLASPAVERYRKAFVRDLIHAYPDISGFRPDWPEYPCYTLGEAFQDFSPHVRAWAEERGVEFESVRKAALDLYDDLHGKLRNRDLRQLGESGGFAACLEERPGLRAWTRLKADLSMNCLEAWSRAIREASPGEPKMLSANAFMPPFSNLTGFDFPRAAGICDAVSPKLYTMHWTVIMKFWAEALLAANPWIEEPLLLRTLARLLDLHDDDPPEPPRLADFRYPEPDEPHPVPDATQSRRIETVLQRTGGRATVTPIVHGYGPLEDFRRRFAIVARSRADGAWVNRYGYLSDEKLDAIGSLWS